MNHLKINILLLLSITLLTFTACEDDDPVIPNEEEVITTVSYTLTPTTGGDPVVLSFQDLDGDGGDAPTTTVEALSANTTYNATLNLLNEADTPVENITEEVAGEAEDHQFFFTTSIADLTVEYDDTDADGNPIGLATKLTTGAAGTGTLTIVLKHKPEKTASGVKDGDITNAGGDTDVEVNFDITVQ